MRAAVPLLLLSLRLASGQEDTQKLHKLFDDAYLAILRESPEIATSFGIPGHNDRWTDYSAEGLARQRLTLVAFQKELASLTGLHALGLSRQQALDYFRENTGGERASEVDRYIAWPGQALSYKIGELKIKELRVKAEKQLGSKFSLRDFHDVILGNGALPLDLLEQQVEAYLKKAAAL